MQNYPAQALPPLNVIHSLSIEAMGVVLGGALLASAASAAYISANRAIYIPFHLTLPCLVKRLMSANGATASGNIDMGIYAADGAGGGPGARLVSSGSTAQAGTDALQYYDITDTLLGAGDFYLAVVMDGAVGTLYRLTSSVELVRRGGMLQQATAFPLPATASGAIAAGAYLPMIGLTF